MSLLTWRHAVAFFRVFSISIGWSCESIIFPSWKSGLVSRTQYFPLHVKLCWTKASSSHLVQLLLLEILFLTTLTFCFRIFPNGSLLKLLHSTKTESNPQRGSAEACILSQQSCSAIYQGSKIPDVLPAPLLGRKYSNSIVGTIEKQVILQFV